MNKRFYMGLLGIAVVAGFFFVKDLRKKDTAKSSPIFMAKVNVTSKHLDSPIKFTISSRLGTASMAETKQQDGHKGNRGVVQSELLENQKAKIQITSFVTNEKGEEFSAGKITLATKVGTPISSVSTTDDGEKITADIWWVD
jgi:hypothetical protein